MTLFCSDISVSSTHDLAKISQKLCETLQNISSSTHNHQLSNYWLLSATDGITRAKTTSFQVLSLVETDITFHLEKLAQKFNAPLKWLRLEWVSSTQETTWEALQQELRKYKRNYFRKSIAFKGKKYPWLLCSEMELNAHACFYNGADVGVAEVNKKNLQAYLKARHGSSEMPEFSDNMEILTFSTDGIFMDLSTKEIHRLSTTPRQHGRRKLQPLDKNNLQPIIKNLTTYLGNQVKENGRFEYGYFPVFGRTINTYNTLRHASSTYALIEGYEFCRTYQTGNLAKLKQQIEATLEYFIKSFIRYYPNNLAYVIEINNEIKLGANAVAILALVKYIQVFPDSPNNKHYLTLAEALAEGIAFMQQSDGSFVHILNATDLSIIAKNRVIYYDGEAAFGLMRLYNLTQNHHWLDIVMNAFNYFISAGHHKTHDHWLSYCSNELIQHCPAEKYFRFAVDNIKDYTHFIEKRITTFPTLLELSMAFHKMLLKLDEFPQFAHVLDGFDVGQFYHALHTRANYLLNGIFFPEIAMFYKLPSSILWGTFIRHHAFRVRIDDVEHYLSGLVAYHQLLSNNNYPKSAQKTGTDLVTPHCSLTAQGVAAATSGKWIIPPPNDWLATGVAIHTLGFKPGSLLVARGKNMDKGFLTLPSVSSLISKGACGIITDDSTHYLDFGVPVLQVQNVRQATLDLGAWARKHFSGRVIGITGSAGKTTTVAMMATALKSSKQVGHTIKSANLPIGTAWNMASLRSDLDYWVMEMAIGQMTLNSQITRPDIALITNIAPAHLEYHDNVENIALKKARIFDAMKPGSYAIICRDIDQFDLIAEKAALRGLKVISYGESKNADMRLLSYEKGIATISINNEKLSLKLKTAGRHMALNAVAVLTVAYLEKFSLKEIVAALEEFEAVDGRGNIFMSEIEGHRVTVYNEAYNANPLSMKAALEAFADNMINSDLKILVVGDMLELGHNSEHLHRLIIERIALLPIKRIILVGKEMCKHAKWLETQDKIVLTAKDKIIATEHLAKIAQTGDHIFLKASNGVGLHSLFKRM